MTKSRLLWIGAATLAMALAALSTAAPQTPPKPAAANILAKSSPDNFPVPLPGNKTAGVDQVVQVLDWLAKYDRDGRQPANKINFRLPESVVNEYLAYALRANPRPGLSSVTLRLRANNEISAEVWIDFDAIAKWNSKILPAPLHLVLNGKKALRVDAQLDARDGVLNYSLKTAYGPAGDIIAKKVMEDIMQSIGLHQREMYNVGRQPIPLPFGLQRMWCEKQLLAGET
jgi:hypothetical protein